MKESVSNARNEDHFSNIWHASQSVLTLTDLTKKPKLPKQQRIPRRLDDGAGVFLSLQHLKSFTGLNTLLYWIVYWWD